MFSSWHDIGRTLKHNLLRYKFGTLNERDELYRLNNRRGRRNVRVVGQSAFRSSRRRCIGNRALTDDDRARSNHFRSFSGRRLSQRIPQSHHRYKDRILNKKNPLYFSPTLCCTPEVGEQGNRWVKLSGFLHFRKLCAFQQKATLHWSSYFHCSFWLDTFRYTCIANKVRFPHVLYS